MSAIARHRFRLRTAGSTFILSLVAMAAVTIGVVTPASATSYVPLNGEGSSWSFGAINQWDQAVESDGMQINYTPNGSTQGRQDFIDGQTDFAASDIPFQTDPTDGVSAVEHPKAGSYAYMPITAGGTVFMYNLMIDGQRVTNLRLSGANIAKIFTGAITNWDDPALAADNPGLQLPDQTIVPVVRSDGSGTSFELSQWMISQEPSSWNAYCAKVGRAPNCGASSFYPTVTGMIAQNGDQGVANYVAANYAQGAIGYVNYYYALQLHFPVVQMLNAAGYYTEPTPQNVAVSLLQDQVDTTDVNNPALYLTQQLSGVYTDPDPRTYPLSSYGYLILPTTVGNSFTTAKGATLAAYSYYAMCQGQSEVSSLGYSPMPINLVQAAFDQIRKIPGAVVQNINIQQCNNPTFTSTGVNLLAQTAPYPPACDKQGPTQCTNGTGGAVAISTAVSRGASAGGGATASAGTSTGGSATGGSDSATATSASGSGAAAAASSSDESCDPSTGACGSSSVGAYSVNPTAATVTLGAGSGWSSTQTLLALIGLALLTLLLVPGLLTRRLERRRSP
ncbi:MAG: phosphate ABC transporter substrate-binding protein PstS [Acidimicrobiales bacterium]|jgi:phosphate transport system substrate-binding protein